MGFFTKPMKDASEQKQTLRALPRGPGRRGRTWAGGRGRSLTDFKNPRRVVLPETPLCLLRRRVRAEKGPQANLASSGRPAWWP